MPIVIGSGISVGPGISILREPPTMRSLLSTTGQAAYDSAITDSWFEVSSTDYANVRSGLFNTSTIGFSDSLIAGSGTNFTQNFGATVDIANAAVPSNNYIIGLVAKTGSGGTGTLTFRPSISGTFRGVYSGMGVNAVVMNASLTAFYWLRKLPEAPVNFTTYLALGVPNGGSGRPWASGGTWGSGTTGGAYSADMNSWTSFPNSIPAQQWLLTDLRQW